MIRISLIQITLIHARNMRLLYAEVRSVVPHCTEYDF